MISFNYESDFVLTLEDVYASWIETIVESENKILGEIKCADKPTIMVFNKIDAYKAEPLDSDDLQTERTKRHYSLNEWKSTWMSKIGNNALFISAINKENLEDFKKRVYDEVRDIHITRFPYNNFLYPDYDETL